jgi:hypothetical protein
MPLDPFLETELRTMLAAFRAAHGPTAIPNAAGKALEAWLLIKLGDTARLSGVWNVMLCRGDGLPLPPGADFLTRSQPGAIAASAAGAPGFVRIAHKREPQLSVELHGGLQWLGRSQARHECDVSLLPRAIGDAIRGSGGGYPLGLPIAALECKEKTSDGTADEMRQTLARLFDLAHIAQSAVGGSGRIFHPHSHAQWGRRSSRYRPFFESGAFGIVRVGKFQLGARQLGQHYHIGRYWGIYDIGSPAVSALQARFKEVLASLRYL